MLFSLLVRRFRAVSQGNIALVHALIDACADVDNQSMVRESPLQVGESSPTDKVAVGGDDRRVRRRRETRRLRRRPVSVIDQLRRPFGRFPSRRGAVRVGLGGGARSSSAASYDAQ